MTTQNKQPTGYEDYLEFHEGGDEYLGSDTLVNGTDSNGVYYHDGPDNTIREVSASQEDDEEDEDPLAGDVDRWVHPDETRTNEQIDFDRRHAIEPYDED